MRDSRQWRVMKNGARNDLRSSSGVTTAQAARVLRHLHPQLASNSLFIFSFLWLSVTQESREFYRLLRKWRDLSSWVATCTALFSYCEVEFFIKHAASGKKIFCIISGGVRTQSRYNQLTWQRNSTVFIKLCETALDKFSRFFCEFRDQPLWEFADEVVRRRFVFWSCFHLSQDRALSSGSPGRRQSIHNRNFVLFSIIGKLENFRKNLSSTSVSWCIPKGHRVRHLIMLDQVNCWTLDRVKRQLPIE